MRRGLLVLLLVACSGEPAAITPEPIAPAPTPAPAVEPVAAPTTPPPAAPAPPAPGSPLPELELLHAVPARVAVSSAYRDDADQAARLIDGDLETAWNSRTGDLVGAWIDIELPSEVTVRAFAITPGYTHVTPRADLFPGNHRISRVRISRDGVAVGEHDLDVERREPVEVPVNAGGGRYRIEVLSTLPGTRTDWQETCVSELRVLGTSPIGVAGSASPVTSVGPLAGSLDEAVDAAEDAELAALDDELAGLAAESYEDLLADWVVYQIGLGPELDDRSATDPVTSATIERYGVERSRHLTTAEEILADTRPAAVAAIRARRTGSAWLWAGRNEDLDALLDGYEALVGESRACRAAEVRVRIRAQALRAQLDNQAVFLESDLESGYDLTGRRLSAARRTELREALTAARAFLAWLDGMRVEGWETLPPDARVTLSSGTLPPPTLLATDWARVGTELERLARACPGG